jgi:type I restriction enzyme, S subunit
MAQIDWKDYSLNEVCREITDGSHFSPKEVPDGEMVIASVKDMNEYDFDLNNCKRISKKDYLELVKNGCKPNQGDILFSKDGTMGIVQHFNGNLDIVLLSSIAILRPNHDLINSKYLTYLLKNPKTNKFIIDNFKSGSALPRIVLKDLKKFRITIPVDLAEQSRIASILSSFDDKIELNLQMNKTLEAIAKAIFKEWFVDFRFPGFDGELVNGLPNGWRKSKIGELISVQNGFAFKSSDFKEAGDIGIVKIKNISNNYVNIEDVQYIDNEIAIKIDPRFRVMSYDLLIAMTGAEVGKVGLVPKTNKSLRLNQRVGKLEERIRYAKWFAYIVLSSPEYQNLLFSSAVGSAQPNISATQIESIETVMPTYDIVRIFGELINPFMARICENYLENRILNQLRDNLLPKLITGTLRVA